MKDLMCRLCRENNLMTVVMALVNAPRNIQHLYRQDELHHDHPINLDVFRCEGCGFVQINPNLEDEYYDDYLMATTHSHQMQTYQAQQAADFVRKFNLQGKKVMEIGCGDGSYMSHLLGAGAHVSGIEPSARFRRLAVERGHEVAEGYIDAGRRLSGAPYDGFVSRQVLEHVPDIHGFLTGIRKNMKPGAVGLIEVPSLEKAIEDRRFYDFFSDHVNYFSAKTLRLALEINGFEVVELLYGMNNEYNIALVRVVQHPSLEGANKAISELSEQIRNLMSEYRAQGKKVAIWGAGGKGLSVLAAAKIDNVDLLIDSDPNKEGLFTPVTHLKVEKPSAVVLSKYSAVIITAMAYRNEIESILRNEYEFRGDIYILGHKLESSENI